MVIKKTKNTKSTRSCKPSVRPCARPPARPSARTPARPLALPSVRSLARPSVRPHARPSVRPPARPSACSSVRLPVRPSVRPLARPSARPSDRPSARPRARPSARSRVRPSVRPLVRPSVRSSVRQSSARQRDCIYTYLCVSGIHHSLDKGTPHVQNCLLHAIAHFRMIRITSPLTVGYTPASARQMVVQEVGNVEEVGLLLWVAQAFGAPLCSICWLRVPSNGACYVGDMHV